MQVHSPRVAQTHLDASGKAAIAAHWATLKARNELRRRQRQTEELFRALMDAVRYGARAAGGHGTAWIDPVVRPGERA